MGTAKITIALDEQVLARLDRLVEAHVFPSRSRAIQEAVADRLDSLDQTRLARECAKLDPAEEKTLAEESLVAEGRLWPEY